MKPLEAAAVSPSPRPRSLRGSAAWLVGLTALASTGCTGFERLPDSDVDAQQRATAQALAVRIYEGCNSGTHPALGEAEAITEMREAFSPAKQAGACGSIKNQFGDYQSLDYAETWKAGSGGLRVYRFKGHFSKSSDTPEIRVVMDGAKLSGFWLKPWSDKLQ